MRARCSGRAPPPADPRTDNLGLRHEWIFGKTTFAYLGERAYLVRDTVNGKKGMLISLSAVLARGVADSAGSPPVTLVTSG